MTTVKIRTIGKCGPKCGTRNGLRDDADSHRTGTRDPGAGNEAKRKKPPKQIIERGGSDDDVVLRQIREAAEKKPIRAQGKTVGRIPEN